MDQLQKRRLELRQELKTAMDDETFSRIVRELMKLHALEELLRGVS